MWCCGPTVSVGMFCSLLAQPGITGDHNNQEPAIDIKSYMVPYFYEPYLVLITMYPGNRVFAENLVGLGFL